MNKDPYVKSGEDELEPKKVTPVMIEEPEPIKPVPIDLEWMIKK